MAASNCYPLGDSSTIAPASICIMFRQSPDSGRFSIRGSDSCRVHKNLLPGVAPSASVYCSTPGNIHYENRTQFIQHFFCIIFFNITFNSLGPLWKVFRGRRTWYSNMSWLPNYQLRPQIFSVSFSCGPLQVIVYTTR